jgi:hypothetical protein
MTGLLTGKRTVRSSYCGYARVRGPANAARFMTASEHILEAREISSFECAVCGETIENWNSAWVPRYRFIACPATDAE